MDGLKIIVAENDQHAERSLARSLLMQEPWQVISADNVKTALRLARSEKPDAILLEGLFPGGALEFLDKLRSHTDTAFIPVLAVAGNMGPQRSELLATGAQACLPRSASPKELYATLKELATEPLVIMETPAGSRNDPQRMSALERTGLLDSPPGDQFDLLTALAAKILGVPVALVSLVDRDRQFFKSHAGLPEPWAKSRQTPLTHSFCQWVVSSKEQLVVQDAREDPLLRDNLAIHELGVIAYAGLPIVVGEDQVIGSFCAIDSHPRTWTFDDLASLRDFSHITEACIAFEQEIFGWIDAAPAIARKHASEAAAAIRSAAKGIEAIMRLLRRPGLILNAQERSTLLGIVETLSQNQLEVSKILQV